MVSSQRFHRPPTVKGNEWHVAIGRHPGDKQNLSSYFLSSFSICNVFMQNLSFFCVRCTRERKKNGKRNIQQKKRHMIYCNAQSVCVSRPGVRTSIWMHAFVRSTARSIFTVNIYTRSDRYCREAHSAPHSLTVSGKQNSQIKSVWV